MAAQGPEIMDGSLYHPHLLQLIPLEFNDADD
jgi:hypothetical protein